jgi:hypothetical protein
MSRRFFDGAQIELGLLPVETHVPDWQTFADGTSATPGATVTGLTTGVTYEFRVAAINSEGQAPWSNIAGPYTPFSGIVPPLTVQGGVLSVFGGTLSVMTSSGVVQVYPA